MNFSRSRVCNGQRTFTIVQRELAHALRAVFLHKFRAGDPGCNVIEDGPEDWIFGADGAGQPFGLGEHVADYWSTLIAVGVEELGSGLPFADQRQLPGEVNHVLDAGVNPLCTRGTMDMRGI